MAGEPHERESILLASVIRGAIGGSTLAALVSATCLLLDAHRDGLAAAAAESFVFGCTFGALAFIELHAARRPRSWRVDLAAGTFSAFAVLAMMGIALGEGAFVASLIRGKGLLASVESAWRDLYRAGDRETLALLVGPVCLPVGALNAARARGLAEPWVQFAVPWPLGVLSAVALSLIGARDVAGEAFLLAIFWAPFGLLLVICFHYVEAAESLLAAWLARRDERTRDE